MTRILLALLAIAVPFVAVYIPLKAFVSDTLLRRAGALLLTVIVVVAYRTYVRCIEQRTVSELAGTQALRELGAGAALGILLFSLTIGMLAALGVYRITGINAWAAILATVPAAILAAVLEEVVFRGVVFRILQQWLGSWIALALSAALFGLLHLFNPGSTPLSAACVTPEASVVALTICTVAGFLLLFAAARKGHIVQPSWADAG